MSQAGRTMWTAAMCTFAALALSACSTFRPDTERQTGQSRVSEGQSSGGGFFGMFGRNDRESDNQQEAGIGVNAYLWRASLDTLSFMPLESADPFGGVIITDWYADPGTPTERFKATVYILDVNLRADALNVSIFRQVQQGGAWVDAAINADTEIQIENAILARARQLRLGQVPS